MTLVFLCLEFVGHKAFQRRWQFIEDQLPSSLGNAKSFCVSLLVYSMRICIYIYTYYVLYVDTAKEITCSLKNIQTQMQ